MSWQHPAARIDLDDGESDGVIVNGVTLQFVRRDRGPTETIEVRAFVKGYACYSVEDKERADYVSLSIWPSERTRND